MSDPKFVDELPPVVHRRHGGRTVDPYVFKLRANPGQWAEVERSPRSEAPRMRGRAIQRCRRHPELEYAVRTVGDEAVLYMRAVES